LTTPTPSFFWPYGTVRRLHGCKCCALLLFVPVASDAPASSGAETSTRRPRLARPEMMEETMQVLTLIELMRLTRSELCDLATRINLALPDYPEGSPERCRAVLNLHSIRRILAWFDLAPG
jgi:hypothetical protein